MLTLTVVYQHKIGKSYVFHMYIVYISSVFNLVLCLVM